MVLVVTKLIINFAGFLGKVDRTGKYELEFNGLKPGLHTFEFILDVPFFESFDYRDLHSCHVSILADMEKEDRMLVFRFRISGTIGLDCDRCADPLDQPLKGEQNLVVKLGDHAGEESEDVLIIRESDGKIDLSQLFYEYVRLMIPAHPVHGEGEKGKSLCNPDVIRKLEELRESHAPDPRWDVLKKLKN
jgi:uncharacterized metal-binding protein YceD (DUF177 family)